ncbi:MAG: PilZ domain-containing protein [Deltaproteobacteria bacterium]|nr:PilZ domain-containing protein [Deltaproteobacteria bacterium]
MSPSFIERRREYRLPLHQKVICTDGQRSSTAFAVNISRGGLFVATLDPFPIDTELLAVLLLPHQPTTVCTRLKVVHVVFDKQRCEMECGMGLQFVGLAESLISILNLHMLNEKMAYLELKKLLAPSKPNLKEIYRRVSKLPFLRGEDLAELRYKVNRICTLFEQPPALEDDVVKTG